MTLADWQRCLAAFAALARALGALRDPVAFDSMNGVVTNILLKKWQDDPYEPARQEAHKLLGRCVVAFIEAFTALGDKRGLGVLAGLERRHGALAGVKQAAIHAREKLK